VNYDISGIQPTPLRTKFGLDASARVGLVNLAGSYGIGRSVEMYINFPIVFADTHAAELIVAGRGSPSNDERAVSPEQLEQQLGPGGSLEVRKVSFAEKGAGSEFQEGTHVGLGRITIGTKAVVYSRQWLRVALAPELLLPSPSAAEFAGTDSAAILPRAVVGLPLGHGADLYVDAGYDFDWKNDELRRFVWSTGGSLSFQRICLDVGVGGSQFNRGIKWTPDVTTFENIDFAGNPQTVTLTANGKTTLGTTFVDFLTGVKAHISERSVLAGAVSVPVNNEGARPAAVGTVAVELYF
jgi:Putative MetA-pathway of phenol degradation